MTINTSLHPSKRRTLDLRFFTLFLVLAVLLGVGTHFLHAYQVKRNASTLLEQARAAEDAQEYEKAVEFLARYMGFNPEDVDVRERHALLLDDVSKHPALKERVYLVFEQVLLRDANRQEVRRRAARLAMAIGRPNDSRTHVNKLLEGAPNDPDLIDQLGQCEEASKNFEEARKKFVLALKLDPKRVMTSLRLASLLRLRLDDAEKADRVMDALILADPLSLAARLARGRYLREIGNLAGAAKDLAFARDKLAADDIDVLLVSADIAQASGQSEEARQYLARGQQVHPSDLRFGVGLARLGLRAGGAEKRAEAVGHLREAVKAAPEDAEATWALADLFIDAGEPAEARVLLSKLTKPGQPTSAPVDFMQARLLTTDRKFGEATTLLEGRRQELTRWPELSRRADILLGTLYEQLGNTDLQLAAFQRVLAVDPRSVPARLGKAAALTTAGRPEEALALYRTLMVEMPPLRLSAVRLLFAQNLRLPPARRNWAEAKSILENCPPEIVQTTDHRSLSIDLLTVTGRFAEALTAAERACRERPKEVRFWIQRAGLAERGAAATDKPDPALALAILDEAAKHVGDITDLRLARAARAAARPAEEARVALQELEKKTDQYTPSELARLEAGLAAAYLRIGAAKEATRLLTQATKRRPDDMALRMQLFDLAMLTANEQLILEQLGELRRIEGDEGILWRYLDAAQLVLAARKGNMSKLEDAKKRLAEVARRRSTWSRVASMEAEIAEVEGNSDLALEKLQLAIDRGERQVRLIRHAIRLLAVRRRTDEARQLLEKLMEQSPAAANDINRLVVEVSMNDRAARQQSLALAREAISPNSRDPRDHLWLGQVLASMGESNEAETSLRKALTLRPNYPEAWIALVIVLAEAGRKDQAKAELTRAEAAVAPEVRPLVQAPCYEALGQAKDAENVYLEMVKSRPEDSVSRRTAAAYYLRTAQHAKAEPHLRLLMAKEGPDAVWARRGLAIALAVTGDYQKSREALALLDQNLKVKGVGAEDERARAILLAQRPSDRKASIAALEDSFARVKPSPSEEFLLAQLYDADRNWPKANVRLLNLLTEKHGDNPVFLAYYVNALLLHEQLGEVPTWLRKLEEVDPNGPRTIELKIRVLQKQGRGDEAATLATDYARKAFAEKKDPIVLAGVANLLTELDHKTEAEALFRQYVAEAEKKRPDSLLVLAAFLASCNRLGEALDLCDKAAAANCLPEAVAGVAVSALRMAEPTPRERDRVKTWLEGAVRQKPESMALLVAQADLLDALEDYAGSEKVYRQLIEKNPSNILALNNLAWLLAVKEGKGEEALDLANQAVTVAGPNGDLLDTRATVKMALGRHDQAIRDLEEAVLVMPTASRYFHLTQAYKLTGNRIAAKESWLKAKALGLKEKVLHPLERKEFRVLSVELAAK